MKAAKYSLLSCWADSLRFFYPSHLKSVLSEAVERTVQTSKILITQWWWLFLIGFIIKIKLISFETATLFIQWHIIDYFIFLTNFYLFISTGLSIFLILFLIYNVSHKRYQHYFTKTVCYSACFFAYLLLCMVLEYIIMKFFNLFPEGLSGILYVIGNLFSLGFFQNFVNYNSIFISPFFLLLIFFMFDSKNQWHEFSSSLCCAFKMSWYNYPWCVIFYVIAVVSSAIIENNILHRIEYLLSLIDITSLLVSYILMLLILFFWLIFLFNICCIFYQQKIQHQHKLYS